MQLQCKTLKCTLVLDPAALPTDLSEFKQPAMVVVIPFEAEAVAREAA